MFRLLSFITGCFLLSGISVLPAQDCPSGEVEVIVQIMADNYPQETSWDLKDVNGTILSQGTTTGDTLCVDSSICLTFTIYDTFGDGICCGYGNGSYTIYLNGIEVASGAEFDFEESASFNCPPGYICAEAIEVSPGSYAAPQNDYWYEFSPNTTGIYTITTCDVNLCNTKIWVYDQCEGINVSEDNTGTLYYDDDDGGCGLQAKISAYLENTATYRIRIGSSNGNCTGAINWELIFGGEIEGCMDPTSCNYNPLATVNDSSCLEVGHPDCGGGPDLWVLESAIRNSIRADVVNNNNDNCLIDEGCVEGFGAREVIRFTTHIKNIGDLDYFIGAPQNEPDQFSYDNCHQHWHYEGYAEYRVYDTDLNLLPVGFKNGFCVIDLECDDGGTPKYGCGNMGISAGCGDYYSSGLQCQWIDVTNLPDGDYTFVTTVNWDRSPDALGNQELRYDNNWAQVCFNLSRDANGHSITLLDECEVVTDCEGTPFGNVAADCNGVCAGTDEYGDLNSDNQQTDIDAEEYIFDIVNGGMDATPCFDLSEDGSITVFDAAIVNDCYLYGNQHQHTGGGNIHDHCNLPGGITNSTHLAKLTILDADFTNNTIDIGISNPNDHINAYEFNMSGMEIVSVIGLTDPDEYTVEPQYEAGGNKVLCISLVDSAISKTDGSYQPLCRIQFNSDKSGEICIEEIIDIINLHKHKINTEIEDGCAEVVLSVNDFAPNHNISIYPNPGNGEFNVHYNLGHPDELSIDVLNYLGQSVLKDHLEFSSAGTHLIDISGEEPGVYFIQFGTGSGVSSKRIILVD